MYRRGTPPSTFGSPYGSLNNLEGRSGGGSDSEKSEVSAFPVFGSVVPKHKKFLRKSRCLLPLVVVVVLVVAVVVVVVLVAVLLFVVVAVVVVVVIGVGVVF